MKWKQTKKYISKFNKPFQCEICGSNHLTVISSEITLCLCADCLYKLLKEQGVSDKNVLEKK